MPKVFVNKRLLEMYASGMSLPDVCSSQEGQGVCISTLRSRLIEAGLLRGRSEAIRLAGKNGKMVRNGLKRPPRSEQWKSNQSKSMLRRAEVFAKTLSKKPNGYMEFTRGPNKGRTEHVVVMEGIIGRRLFANEQVHHKNEIRHDNRPENLELLTRSEHMKLHGLLNSPKRKRLTDGTFC